MAKQSLSSTTFQKKPKKKGLQAKNKTSYSKNSKLYKKPYKGQGR